MGNLSRDDQEQLEYIEKWHELKRERKREKEKRREKLKNDWKKVDYHGRMAGYHARMTLAF